MAKKPVDPLLLFFQILLDIEKAYPPLERIKNNSYNDDK